jgi:hypothetical protein
MDIEKLMEESDRPSPLVLQMRTRNGYRIEYQSGAGLVMDGETLYSFAVHSPRRWTQLCTVALRDDVRGLVKEFANMEELPHGTRFWEALCEGALADYLGRRGMTPPDGFLRIEALSDDMKQWIIPIVEAACSGAAK